MFTRTKRGANRVAEHLEASEVRAEALHGNKSQPAREKSLDRFRTGRARVLVATDIASRGIDVKGISHVINFDLPVEPESYVHRIGRTARAGADGIAISFCDNSERPALRAIERMMGLKVQPVGEVPAETAEPRASKGRPGQYRPQARPFASKPGGAKGPSAEQQRRRRNRGSRPAYAAA